MKTWNMKLGTWNELPASPSATLLPPQPRLAAVATLCLLLACVATLLLSGCSTVKVYDDNRAVGFTATIPSWPWQDSTRVIDRMNLSARTNGFTASMRGLNEEQSTSTHATQLVTDIVAAVVRAAVKP